MHCVAAFATGGAAIMEGLAGANKPEGYERDG
jgi:hypothetical protein